MCSSGVIHDLLVVAQQPHDSGGPFSGKQQHDQHASKYALFIPIHLAQNIAAHSDTR